MTIEKYCLNVSFNDVMSLESTKHIDRRAYRFKRINDPDEIVAAFFVDKGHINGPEIHYVTKRARILIINAYTQRFITILNARPGQIARYYLSCNEMAPEVLMHRAYKNKRRHINV